MDFIGCNIFFTVFIVCGYVLFATARLKLTENEVEAKEMAKEKKKTILKGIDWVSTLQLRFTY